MCEEILIQDGVKYRLWTPENEPADFEPMIKHHIKDIFGEDARYFPKQKLKTLANNNSIPDGFVVDLKNQRWYVIELKLLCDDAVKRISDQIINYKIAMDNTDTRNRVLESIYHEMNKAEMHPMLYDIIINKNPYITVLIDRLDGELGAQFREKVGGADKSVKIVEFKTFSREWVDPKKVHIHLYNSAFEINSTNQGGLIKKHGIPPINSIDDNKEIETNVTRTMMRQKTFISVGVKGIPLFPDQGVEFMLSTDIEDIGDLKVNIGANKEIWSVAGGGAKTIKDWFKGHPELKPEDKLSIKELEHKKRYYLKILK